MGTTVIEFELTDEDQEQLAELIDYFALENLSAYLKATLPIMQSIRRADILRNLQANSQRRLAHEQVNEEVLDELIQATYKKRNNAIIIEQVPEKLRNELAACAERNGQSLQEFLLTQLNEIAARESTSRLIKRARERAKLAGTRLNREDIIFDRDADRK